MEYRPSPRQHMSHMLYTVKKNEKKTQLKSTAPLLYSPGLIKLWISLVNTVMMFSDRMRDCCVFLPRLFTLHTEFVIRSYSGTLLVGLLCHLR